MPRKDIPCICVAVREFFQVAYYRLRMREPQFVLGCKYLTPYISRSQIREFAELIKTWFLFLPLSYFQTFCSPFSSSGCKFDHIYYLFTHLLTRSFLAGGSFFYMIFSKKIFFSFTNNLGLHLIKTAEITNPTENCNLFLCLKYE